MGMANDMGDIMSHDGLCEFRVMTTICYCNRLVTMSKFDRQNAVKSEVICHEE